MSIAAQHATGKTKDTGADVGHGQHLGVECSARACLPPGFWLACRRSWRGPGPAAPKPSAKADERSPYLRSVTRRVVDSSAERGSGSTS